MNITYSYMKPLGAEKIALDSAGSTASADSNGRSAVIKIISGSAYVCGDGSPLGENCYILDENDILRFCGKLKIMAKSASFEARVLYFDSI